MVAGRLFEWSWCIDFFLPGITSVEFLPGSRDCPRDH